MNFKNLPNSNHAAKRNPNVLHSILSQQRPIAPKNESLTPTKSNDEEEKMQFSPGRKKQTFRMF